MRRIAQKPENQIHYTVIHSFHDQEYYNGVYASSMAEAILISQSEYGGRVIIAKEAWLVPYSDTEGEHPKNFDGKRINRILSIQLKEDEIVKFNFDNGSWTRWNSLNE